METHKGLDSVHPSITLHVNKVALLAGQHNQV